MKRRAFGAAILLGGATVANAQVAAFGATGNMVRALQEHALVPTLDPGNPFQKTTTEADQKVPEPESKDKAFQIILAKSYRQEGDVVTIRNGAEFMYRGYHVFANEVEGNLTSSIFSLRGDVKIIGEDALISGESVTIDFEKKIYHATKSYADVKPGLLKGNFVKDLYAHGMEAYGSANEQQILFGDITSCDQVRPHYDITGDNIIIRPGKRAIFRKARVKLFGRTIIKIPYLVIPLDDRSYNNLPIIGQSPVEGYYVKWRYGIPLKGENILYTHLDYMSKLGLGVGGDYLYRSRLVDGTLQVYTIAGAGQMLKITDDHNQKFKWGTLSFRTDYEKNNYLVAPDTTTESTQALLTFPQRGNGMTRLTVNQSGSNSNGFSSSNESFAIADTRHIGDKIITNFALDYQQNGTTYQSLGGPSSQTTQNMNLKANVTDDLGKATADLTYQRNIPIGTTQATFGGNNQTPVVTLATDARRLVGGEAAQNWPFHTSLSIGEFSDQLKGSQITRDYFDFGFNKSDRSTGPFHSDVQAEFKQGLYSDGTAEYVLNFSDTESYRIAKQTSVNFRYNYLRPYGFSPLPIDFTGQTNVATTDVSFHPVKSLSIGAQSGYDVLRAQHHEGAWQPVGVRMEFQPKDYFLLRAQSTYDTFQQAWSNIRVDMSYKPGATFVSLGAYYDGIRHTWSNVNIFLDSLKMGRTQLSAILNFNGFTGRFDNQQYSMIYDLHCAEAVFTVMSQNTGFNAGTTYQFFFRLKAFPFNSSFGAGSRGQPLGTGTGTSY